MVPPDKPRRKKKANIHFVATCGAGLEELVKEEVRENGGSDPVSRPGAVSWQGKLESGYRMCLWSRFASRILLEIASFAAPDPDTLYRQTGKLDWDEHFGTKSTFAVFSTITDSPIGHSKYAALRVKDAIADQFRSRTGRRPDVDPNNPDVRVNLHLHGTMATMAIDLSGESLHRRGYRVMGVEAPLKETLAAGIVQLAGFSGSFSSEATLLDPMCGSATLLIEAAMIYGDVAPGLERKQFGFQGWKKHDNTLWEKLVSEAVRRENEGLEKPWPSIIGYDADPQAVKASRMNIEAAGLEEKIQVSQRQLAFLERPAENGMMLINPPYGERLSEKEAVKYLYRCIGRKMEEELHGWQIGFFSANPDLAGNLKIQWKENYRLYNGPIKCKLHNGIADRHEQTEYSYPSIIKPDPDMEGIDFANRLVKNYSALQPWAEREGITCFRIYDADLPEYNLTVDLYQDWLHVQEYPAPKTIDAKKARNRMQLGLHIIRQVLGIPHSRLFIKDRRAAKKGRQQQKKPQTAKLLEVNELQCRFLVNFTDYPKTGLSFAHRGVRILIGRLAAGKKFLNLFGETGTETVHALVNNAMATTTVVKSKWQLERSMGNMALNGFGGPQHQIIEQDSIKWLEQSRERYSLIYVAPPAFIEDQATKIPFAIEKDHQRILQLCMKRLSRDGELIFATGARKLVLAESLLEEFDISEQTKDVFQKDFSSKPEIVRCWKFRHKQETT